jgi:hypothetical protein
MIVPKGSQDPFVERNVTTVFAVLALATFMALTTMLLILSYDRAPDPRPQAAIGEEMPSN